MTFTQINVFIEVVNLKNFTRAGEKLGMTQSAVSHSISGLEKHLGVKLLMRSKSGLSITQNGEIVYKKCLEIQRSYQSIYSDIIQTVELPSRTLKIGTLPSISVSILPKIIRTFNQTYPQVEIILFEGNDSEVLNWLGSKTIDIGFITLPNDQFDYVFIIQDEMHVVMSSDSKLSNSKSIAVKQIQGDAFIMSSSGCEPVINEIFRKGNIRPNTKYSVSSLTTILEMVKEHVGISIMPELALRSYPSALIAHRPLKSKQYRSIGLGSHTSIKDDLTLNAFAEVSKSVALLIK